MRGGRSYSSGHGPNIFADSHSWVADRSRVMGHCRLCDLPTPDPPVTATGVDGEFCCRGCLEVARRLDDADDRGIAMGDGTARAVEAADVVIADEDLRAVETVFDLAAGTRRRIRGNVAWALCYNPVAIPLAVAGALNPFFAALAMAASSGIVVTNSARSVL